MTGVGALLPLLTGEDNTVVFLLEPLHGVFLAESMGSTHAASLGSSLVDVEARSAEDNEKVQTVDTDGGVVFDSQIDVLLNAKAKVSGCGKVFLAQFVFLDLRVIDKVNDDGKRL